MDWDIEGTDEFDAWYQGLAEPDRERVDSAVDKLAELGPTLGRPFVDRLTSSEMSNLKELRTLGAHLRVIFVFDPRRTAILLLGGDKTNDWDGWYRRNIPEAENLYKIYIEELIREGLLPETPQEVGVTKG